MLFINRRKKKYNNSEIFHNLIQKIFLAKLILFLHYI